MRSASHFVSVLLQRNFQKISDFEDENPKSTEEVFWSRTKLGFASFDHLEPIKSLFRSYRLTDPSKIENFGQKSLVIRSLVRY